MHYKLKVNGVVHAPNGIGSNLDTTDAFCLGSRAQCEEAMRLAKTKRAGNGGDSKISAMQMSIVEVDAPYPTPESADVRDQTRGPKISLGNNLMRHIKAQAWRLPAI